MLIFGKDVIIRVISVLPGDKTGFVTRNTHTFTILATASKCTSVVFCTSPSVTLSLVNSCCQLRSAAIKIVDLIAKIFVFYSSPCFLGLGLR